jgi:5-(carboxyamino)imidazole ribonucleotide mutase
MNKLVRVILGSKSDLSEGNKITEYLEMLGIKYDLFISSAHRNPEKTIRLVKEAEENGYQLFIAAAGMAAHLPGVIASQTNLPVIGVPLKSTSLSGEDALYSIVQMPTGIPVATVAINGSKNSAILAAQILSLKYPEIKENYLKYRKDLSK